MLLVTVVALLTYLASLTSTVHTPPIQTAAEYASTAIDMTKAMTEEPGSQSRSETVPIGTHMNVKGIALNVDVLPGNWAVENTGTQAFLRKSDGRLCQITANAPVDVSSLQTETRGREVDFEAALMSELLTAGANMAGGKGIETKAEGTLLFSESGPGLVKYGVRLITDMSTGTTHARRLAVISTVAKGDRLVRLSCMNMGGITDNGEHMAKLARSLALAD
ncbi:hypothetical protein [Acidovorax sp. RAC01]|uniref:hypothetical protein n=1 Tax=Acidovorax sp. RAC01 TaxID=1842533 RepID=UPI00083E8891|nr:hypothetical protein [Acidovorax sp. RAC01]